MCRAGVRIAKRESGESARAESERENHAHAGAPRPSPRGRAHGFAIFFCIMMGCCVRVTVRRRKLELPFSDVGLGVRGGPA